VLVVAPGEQRRHLRRRSVTALPRPQRRVGGVRPPRHAADGPDAAALPREAGGGKGREAPRWEERPRRAGGDDGARCGGHGCRGKRRLVGREGDGSGGEGEMARRGSLELDGVLMREGDEEIFAAD
jgi:hypothetical protein